MEQTGVARRLRGNMTDAELKLWSRLRNGRLAGHKFRRQMPLAGYIADFVNMRAKLVVEVDGSQHSAMETEDQKRTTAIEAAGYHVIRFWNNDVLSNTDGVLAAISEALKGRLPD